MATFNLLLDKRNRLRNGRFNLVVRIFEENTFVDLRLEKLTENQFKSIFVRNATDAKSIEFRKRCNEIKGYAESIYDKIGYLDKNKIRTEFYNRNKSNSSSILLKDLFGDYTQQSETRISTKDRYAYSLRVLQRHHKELDVTEIDKAFLNSFERTQLRDGLSIATISGTFRDLRAVINHFIYVDKRIPETYKYPFGKGGYSIKTSFSTKQVLDEDEIQKILEYDSENHDLLFARDMWEFLYRCNGINFIDAFLMKWTCIQGEFIVFHRRKTETTRRNNRKAIEAPFDKSMKEIIERWSNRTSPYIFGYLTGNENETYIYNKVKKTKKRINQLLKSISEELQLSLPLTIKTARETYATTLLRNGVSKDEISEMLGHSNSTVTEHYLAGLNKDTKRRINSVLPKRGTQQGFPQGFNE
jgi:integrase|tara:strand:+ start:626 stop:1870 length:1245 start_codon:yes stop_codon:yes gene_type:complete